MLVLTRKVGEWLNIGNIYYIETLGFITEGKHEGKIKTKVILEEVYGISKEEIRYIEKNNNIKLGHNISISFLESKGNQFKLGIEAPEEYLITRFEYDEENEVYVEEEEADDIKDKYSELSWFFDMK